jgi:hypothetical protein
MKDLSAYIKNLNFEYAISYSGLRGHDFELLEKANHNQVNILKNKMKMNRILKLIIQYFQDLRMN